MAEEIGRRVAFELNTNFAKLGSDLLAQRTRQSLAAETFASLRKALTFEVRGFNQVVQRDFRLTMLPGQNCLVFSFETRLALTLKVDISRVRLILAPPTNPVDNLARQDASIEFAVSQQDGHFTYQRIVSSHSAPSRTLSQPEFIEGIIRVACSRPFERPEAEPCL